MAPEAQPSARRAGPPPFLIYGTGIRIPPNPLKTKPRLRSNIRYTALPGIMLHPLPPALRSAPRTSQQSQFRNRVLSPQLTLNSQCSKSLLL